MSWYSNCKNRLFIVSFHINYYFSVSSGMIPLKNSKSNIMAPFKNNSLRVPYALAVHDNKETERVIKVLLEKRTNMSKETLEFEKNIAKLFGKKYGVMVNSEI